MDIRQLRYFLAIVEEGKISQAARRLHIAQPPLSQQLKLLETEMGVTLLERNTRRLTTTEAGKLLYDRAKIILELVNGTMEEIKELSEGVRGTLAIGTIASLGAKLLPERIHDFQKRYPEVRFQVWEGDPNRVMELLENRIIELGIVRLPVNNGMFNMINLPAEPLVAAMSRHWNIGDNQPYVKLSDLENKPLMLLRRQQGTSMYHHRMYIMDLVEDACREAGFEPKIICESNDIMTLLTWANHDVGITIVPQSAMNLIPNAGLQFKEIIEPSIMSRPSAIIWLKGRYLSTTSKKFLEYFPLDKPCLEQ